MSHISNEGKVFEKIIKSNLQNHLKSHNLLPPKLYGCRPKSGTDQEIAKVFRFDENL